jgi:hypothetical protein
LQGILTRFYFCEFRGKEFFNTHRRLALTTEEANPTTEKNGRAKPLAKVTTTSEHRREGTTSMKKFCVIKPSVESPLYDTAAEAQAVADKLNAGSHGFTYHVASCEISDGHRSSETAQALESMEEQVDRGRIERRLEQIDPPKSGN